MSQNKTRKHADSFRNSQSHSSGIVGLNRLMGKRLKIQNPSNGQEEQKWEAETSSKNRSIDRTQLMLLIGFGVMFLFISIIAIRYLIPKPSGNQAAAAPMVPLVSEITEEDEPAVFTRPPKEIAKIFLSLSEPEERLKWVRNPEMMREHMKSYSEQVLQGTSEQLTPLGMGGTRHFIFARFMVTFSNEDTRSLFVIATPNGPLIDWDAYARYNSASWGDILSGKSQSAEVRVFVEHSDYYNFLYRDESEWSCYRLTSPDLKDSLYAYAKKRSKQEIALASVQSLNKAIPVVLGISTTQDGLKHRQITIDRVYAFSWIRGEVDLDKKIISRSTFELK